MSSHDYTVRWLVPEDSQQLAELEARVHVSEHRAGDRLIWEQLEATESDGRNLSLGLYYGGKLVGFGLAFVMSDRREMASFFDAPLPAGLDPDESTIYIADWVVEPEHRRTTKLMAMKFAEIVRQREDLIRLPADAFATTEYAEKWCAPNAFFAKLGWVFVSRHPFEDARLGKTLHWLHFKRVGSNEKPQPALPSAPVSLIQSPEEWQALRLYWNDLLARTPEASPLQSWEYLRAWYAHFGVIEQPFIVLVQREGKPMALAPFQVATLWQRGRHRRILTNPAATAEAPISRVLVASDDDAAMTAIADQILSDRKSWEDIELSIASSQMGLTQRLRERLRGAGFPVDVREGGLERRVDAGHIDMSRLDERQLSQHGPLRFEMSPVANPAALERYFDLEHEAPDDEAGTGACASSRHISFYRALARSHAAALGLHIGFLHAGEECAAGLLGFLWRKQFHIVHITRPESFAPANARGIALARLIEWCFTRGACDSVDLSALKFAAADTWPARISRSMRIGAHEASIAGWWRHATRGFTS